MTTYSRCQAGERCADPDWLRDPDTGERITRIGALIDGGPLCDACVAAVDYALAALPADFRDLGRLLPPSLAPKLQDPDLPMTHTKPSSKLPLEEAVLELLELAVHEATSWANSVAEAAGMFPPSTLDLDEHGARIDPRTGEWDPALLEQMGWQARIEQSCALLGFRVLQLLQLDLTEHRARSLGVGRVDGHDPERTTRFGDDYWTKRFGWEGALTLVDLHLRAEQRCGRHPGDRIHTPCPHCLRRTLVREHRNEQVVCRYCKKRRTDDQHAAFINAALDYHGPAGYEPRLPAETDAAAPPALPVGRGGLPGRYEPTPGPWHGPLPPPPLDDAECGRTGLPASMCGCPRHQGKESA